MTIAADSNGVVRGKFTIPPNVPSGTTAFQIGGAGGQAATVLFSGQGKLEHQTWQQQTDITTTRWQSPPPPPPPMEWSRGTDPLAQTFTVSENLQVAGLDLWFYDGPLTNVSVQIRDTIAGVPGQKVLASATLKPSDIALAGTTTQINFAYPTLLLAGVEYAIVVLCGDANGSVYIAEIGKFDITAQKWITDQPYNVGVLLSSSNASTWTAHQDRDMAFRLWSASFTETTKVVSLGNVAVTNVTDLMLLSYADRPSGQSDVAYKLTLPDGTLITVGDGQPVQLPAAITGNVAVSAVLKGDNKLSPVLHPGSQLVTGIVAQTADYVTRAIPGGSSVAVKVVYEAFVPSGSTITVQYKGPDVGDVWTTIGSPTTRPVDNGFVEFTHAVSGVNEATVQIKLILTGNTAARPRVRDLRTFVL